MNTKTSSKEESGQVLILLTIGLVALLGLTALALDGGLIYADRRYDQNVADAAAFAGAGAAALQMENRAITDGNFNCSNSDMAQVKTAAAKEAISRAARNGFAIDQDLADLNGISIDCDVSTVQGIVDQYVNVHVTITSSVKTSFAHLFYTGEIKNTVEAVARARPRSNLAKGYAIVATDTSDPEAILFDGNVDIFVDGGGIISNAGIRHNGGPKITVTPNTLPIHYATTCTKCDNKFFDPDVSKAPARVSGFDIQPPDCDLLPSRTYSGEATLQPGRFSAIKVTGNKNLELEPGLYCIDGEFSVQNGDLTGVGVTIYMKAGRFKVTGGKVNLAAPTGEAPPAIRNVVIYAAKGNNKDIFLEGNSGSTFTGTIYGPDSVIDLGGTGDIEPSYHTQIIGRTIKVHGNAAVRIQFEPDLNYTRPTYLELYR